MNNHDTKKDVQKVMTDDFQMRQWVEQPAPLVIPSGGDLVWTIMGQFVGFVISSTDPPLDWMLESFDFLPSVGNDERFVLKFKNNGEARKLEGFAVMVKGYRAIEKGARRR